MSASARGCLLKCLPGVVFALALAALVGCGKQQKPAEPPPLKGWQKVEQRLKQFDKSADEAARKRLDAVKGYLAQRQKGADGFAEEALSWWGKWELVKDQVGAGDHARYLAELFERHLFTPADLKAVVEAAVKGYLSDLDGLENNLLVQLRADLKDDDLGRGRAREHLKSDEAFRTEYRRLTTTLLPGLVHELKFTVGRELLAFILMDLGTQLSLDIGAGVATELGFEASILRSGIAGGVTTVGVGLVVGLVVDAVIDWLLKKLGHDPQSLIAQEVRASVNRLRDRLIDGDAAAKREYDQLRQKAQTGQNSAVRDASRQAAERLESSGRLGLQWELRRIQEIRARLRQEALRKLLVEEGTP